MTWSSGDRIIVRGADWRVLRAVRFSDCEALDLAGERSTTTRTLLLPFDRPRSPSLPRYRVVSRQRWAREVGAQLRSTYPFGGLRYCPHAIRLLPYQLEPALAVFRHGALRVLVADDVGLGKTVEAGLIVNEIARTNPNAHVLILCPAAIRDQWAQELSTLFDLEAIPADSAWLRRAARELPHDVNPWSVPGTYLASADFIKRPEALRPLEDVRWDLLVVDEAHMATPASHRLAAIHAVARRSYRVVLLTATPHSGDEEQFAALCGLGAEAGAPAVVMFRRSRADTPFGNDPPRSTILPVTLTAAEQTCHRLLESYTERLWRESSGRPDSRAHLVATLFRKRALSSLHCLLLSVRRRLQLLAEPGPATSQLLLPLFDEEDLGQDAPGDEVLGVDGLCDKKGEQDALRAIAAAAAAAGIESKERVLLRLLRRAAEPAIVFTEYRDTAEHLADVLIRAGHRTAMLHGGLPRHERAAVLADFPRGGLLVATDAASEGLNLQHNCRLVVHFELPWAPLRLHQRRGRVYRIGQVRRVHEIALVANDTCEQFVLRPLMERARRASTVTSQTVAAQFSESRVAAHVMGGAPLEQPPPQSPPGSCDTTSMDLRSDALAEAERLLLLRRAQGCGTRPRNSATPQRAVVPVSAARPGSATATLTLVVIVTIRDRANAAVERLPLVVALHSHRVQWRRDSASALRRQVSRALDDVRDGVASFVDGLIGERVSRLDPMSVSAAAALGKRHLEMQVALRSAARELVQAGLFDRRAMRAAGARERAQEILRDDLAGRAAPDRQGDGIQATYEIAAVLAGTGR